MRAWPILFLLTSRCWAGVLYIEGPRNPEDLIVVPGTPWVIASGLATTKHSHGALYLIDQRDSSWHVLYPSTRAGITAPATRDAACARPPEASRFSAHGLSIRSRSAQSHLVYVVHHGERESVEIFDLDATRSPPSIAWQRCIPLPHHAVGNSVVALSDSHFAVTVSHRADDSRVSEKIANGETTGEVLEWRSDRGWTTVPGSEGSFPNGIEASSDGQWLFVTYTGIRQIVRLAIGDGSSRRVVIQLGMLVDNLRWNDGEIWLTGQQKPCSVPDARVCTSPYDIVRIDPYTLQVSTVPHPDTAPAFGAGTSAVRVGDEVWVGTYQGDQIARFRLDQIVQSR